MSDGTRLDPNEYGTPSYLLDACREVQGGDFTLDAFSSAWHAERTGIRCYLDRERDAHEEDWIDELGPVNVWANPPYCGGSLESHVLRWIHAIESNWTLNAWLLVPATPSTIWAQRVLAWPHCLLSKRVRHHHPTLPPDRTLHRTRHDSMVLYAGPRTPAFRAVFAELGVVR